MKSYKFIILIISISILFLSCNKKDNPVIVTPQENPYPSGLPNWNSKEFDWIDTAYTIMGNLYIYPVNPKYCFTVEGCSPDGNTLLIQQIGNPWVFTYNLNSKIFNSIINRSIAAAKWTTDGNIIGFQFESYSNNDIYYIYNLTNNNNYFIPVADTFQAVFGEYFWWQGDTTYLTGFMGPSDKISHSYLVNINAPYKMQKRDDLNYGFEPYKNRRYCFTGDSINNQTSRNFTNFLEIKNDSNITIGKYPLPGISQPEMMRISPNGKYIAFLAWADLTNTKRYRSDFTEFYGLGIIDLQNLSQGNIIYRYFPDFTNRYRRNSNVNAFTLGAWSSDSKYFYHPYIREDTTVQIVKRNIYTGSFEFLTNLTAPLK